MSDLGYRQKLLRLSLALLCCSLALIACQAQPLALTTTPTPLVAQEGAQSVVTVVRLETVNPTATRSIQLPESTVAAKKLSTSAKLTVRPPAPIPTRKPAAPKKIILVGHPEHGLPSLARYLQDYAGYDVSVNTQVPSADLVLIVVSAPDGPMPQTRQAIEQLDGQPATHAAILLTRADQMDDPELQELVLLEMRELLTPYVGYEQAQALPVLLTPNPSLIPELRALMAGPRAPVKFALPIADHQPILLNVYVSEDESSGHLVLNQFIDLIDVDGDVDTVEFEVASSDVGTIGSSYGLIDAPAADQITGTTAVVPWDCGDEVYTATLSATLLDRAGNRSNSVEYTIICF